ncbi:hypothetical protein N7513_003235 [Penicillium frequentans]|uniref:Uncharacterized protein n=1 Tax=Penicillium frequentans TaxID=3151616 RepID=A0AAD6CJ41_9EURO|nr:hypothetical protein N7494_013220 [Penicillium glabrum]KAJ5557649.1 hypothetical protein N7513_003235 [Penicillium glabrum]
MAMKKKSKKSQTRRESKATTSVPINSNIDYNRPLSSIADEYRRSVLVYHASRICEISGLEALAKHYIERFGERLSLYDVLRLTRDVFSHLPEGETWLPIYIRSHLQRLKVGKLRVNLPELYITLGQDHHFDITVMKMVIDMLSAQISDASLKEGPAAQEPVDEEPTVEKPTVDEPTADEPTAEEPAVEEPAVEESATEDSATEESADENSVPKDHAADEPTVERWTDEWIIPETCSDALLPLHETHVANEPHSVASVNGQPEHDFLPDFSSKYSLVRQLGETTSRNAR